TSAPASAAAADTTVHGVSISVVDPRTGNELTVLGPDGEIALLPGEEVLLRLFTAPANRRADRRTLPASFGFGPTQTPLEIVSSSHDRGEALIRLNDAAAGQRLRVGYKLAEYLALADPSMRLGGIRVRVAGAGNASITGQQYSISTPGQYASRPDAIVAALYRGILLREPDSGAAGARDDIARNGYNAIGRIAANIAGSEESRYLVYQDRGVNNAQRLDALYRELLGWTQADVGPDRWDSDLRELERGNLAGVVDAIVRSEQFRSRFGF
ncbi:MAG TPA: hypothetical protein VN923_02470, partial [Thermoanaerobaculia bacterium]|nr:hypothetical protein [Thermoanaerobaculia bacterium]